MRPVRLHLQREKKARASEPTFPDAPTEKDPLLRSPGTRQSSITIAAFHVNLLSVGSWDTRLLDWGVCICVICGTESWTTACVLKPASLEFWSKDGCDIWEKAFRPPPLHSHHHQDFRDTLRCCAGPQRDFLPQWARAHAHTHYVHMQAHARAPRAAICSCALTHEPTFLHKASHSVAV